MSKATKRPWVRRGCFLDGCVTSFYLEIGEDQELLCHFCNGEDTDRALAEANADFIGRAINAHDALVSACEGALAAMCGDCTRHGEESCGYGECYVDVYDPSQLLRAALKAVND